MWAYLLPVTSVTTLKPSATRRRAMPPPMSPIERMPIVVLGSPPVMFAVVEDVANDLRMSERGEGGLTVEGRVL